MKNPVLSDESVFFTVCLKKERGPLTLGLVFWLGAQHAKQEFLGYKDRKQKRLDRLSI